MAFSLFQILKGLKITQENTLTPTNVVINPGGTANTTTTIQASQTTDKTLTLPDATDTLVGKATTDTLTNKSIDSATNTVSNLADANIKAGANIDAAKVGTGVVSTTEFNYLDGVTSAIQIQLDAKQATGNYITALTGDVVATGPGSATATIQPGVVTDSKLSTGINANKIGAGAVDNTEFSYLDGVTSAIQTQIDSKAPISTTVTLTGTQTLTNKTLTEPIINDIVLTQIATPANPAANSNKVYTKSDNKLYVLNSDGTETVVGSGGTGVNFIVGGDAEGLNPFLVTKNTAAASRPDSGFVTSGTTITTSITSTTPLNGTKSFLITKPASNAQGNQASIPFSVPLEYRAKAITITLPYIVNTGTYVAGDRTTDSDTIIYIYDVTNSTFIEPSNIKFLSNSSSIASSVQATFQTSATGASYKLLVHVATTSAVAWELKCDDIVVGPQNYQYGTPVTDMSTTVVTGSWVSNTTYTAKSQRVGDTMKFDVSVNTSGAPTATNLLINLPVSIDTTKLSQSNSGFTGILSSGGGMHAGTGYTYNIIYNTPTSVYIVYQSAITGAIGTVTATAPFTWGSGDYLNVIFEVPVVGLSSSVQTSDQTDTRVVAASYNLAGAVSSGPAQPTNFATLNFDTHSAVTTGSAWKFTAPVPGMYEVSYTLASGTSGCDSFIYKNGVLTNLLGTGISNAAFNSGTTLISLNSGDFIDVRFNVLQNTNSNTSQNISIKRISGPSAIAASESVNARYYGSATTISGSLTTVVWTTKDFDSHNVMSSGIYTVPTAGKYLVNVGLLIAGTIALNTSAILEIQKNGTVVSRNTEYAGGAITNQKAWADDVIYCLAGDTLQIKVSSSATLPTIVSSNFDNYVAITKVGL